MRYTVGILYSVKVALSFNGTYSISLVAMDTKYRSTEILLGLKKLFNETFL